MGRAPASDVHDSEWKVPVAICHFLDVSYPHFFFFPVLSFIFLYVYYATTNIFTRRIGAIEVVCPLFRDEALSPYLYWYLYGFPFFYDW